MVFDIISVVVTIVLVALQKYLSIKKNVCLGAIVPVISAVLMVGIFLIKDFSLSWKTLLPCVLILVLEILIWIEQRIKYKRIELEKMIAKDI